jgi:DNA-directed RNA polymerase specialized sigma subunit
VVGSSIPDPPPRQPERTSAGQVATEWDAGKVEEEYRAPFRSWLEHPDPKTTSQLLKSTRSEIDRQIRYHTGQDPDPYTRAQAKQMILHALPNYDRRRAGLRTFVSQTLQGLKRRQAQRTNILGVPEAVRLQQAELAEAETALDVELGRAPSTRELADRTGMSIKRIAYVRSLSTGVPESQAASWVTTEEGESEGFMPAVDNTSTVLRDLVYEDLGPIDQRIMEHTLGLHGSQVLGNRQLAGRLGISASAVSQRKARIQKLLDEAYSHGDSL